MAHEAPTQFHKTNRTEHRIRAENLAFDIDVWYPRLKKFTFETVFLPLSRTEAAAIREFHNATWRHARTYGLTPLELAQLVGLEARLDAALSDPPFSGGRGAMLRLCGRSPKDGEPLDRSTAAGHYERECAKLGLAPQSSTTTEGSGGGGGGGGVGGEGNMRLVAIGRSTPSWLRVRSGAEALSLLLTSERWEHGTHARLGRGLLLPPPPHPPPPCSSKRRTSRLKKHVNQ